MKKQIAELSTKFSADGVEDVKRAAEATGAAVKKPLDEAGNAHPEHATDRLKESAEKAEGPLSKLVDRLKEMGHQVIELPMKAFEGATELAHKAVEKVVDSVKEVVSAGGKILGLGGLITSGGVLEQTVEAVKESADTIHTAASSADALGVSVEEYSKLVAMAEELGVSLDDARNQFTRLNTEIGKASDGDKTALAAFARLGVSVTDASGRAKSFTTILGDLGDAVSHMDAASRSAALTQLFGRGNQGQLLEILNGVSRERAQSGDQGLSGVPNALGETNGFTVREDGSVGRGEQSFAERAGAIITDQDVAEQKQYTAAVADSKDAIEGLKLGIFRTLGPLFIALIHYAANTLVEYRDVIIKHVVGAFLTLYGIAAKVYNFLFWTKTGQGFWHAVGVGLQALGYALEVVAGLAAKAAHAINDLIRDKTGRSIGEWLGATDVDVAKKAVDWIIQKLSDAAQVAKDLWNVILGHFGRVSDEDPIAAKAEKWRGIVVTTGAWLLSWIVNAAQTIGNWFVWAFTVSLNAFNGFMAGWHSQDISPEMTAWQKFGWVVKQVVDWFGGLFDNIVKVFALGEQADPSFAWLNDVKQWVDDVIVVFEKFYSILKTINDWMRNHLGGIDLTQTLLWISLLKFIGKWTGFGKLLDTIAEKLAGIQKGGVLGALASGAGNAAKAAWQIGTDAAVAAGGGVRGFVMGTGKVIGGLGVLAAPGLAEQAFENSPTNIDEYDQQVLQHRQEVDEFWNFMHDRLGVGNGAPSNDVFAKSAGIEAAPVAPFPGGDPNAGLAPVENKTLTLKLQVNDKPPVEVTAESDLDAVQRYAQTLPGAGYSF